MSIRAIRHRWRMWRSPSYRYLHLIGIPSLDGIREGLNHPERGLEISPRTWAAMERMAALNFGVYPDDDDPEVE